MKVYFRNAYRSPVHIETISHQGYLNNPEATKNAITPDGWFKTGDIAVRDAEGYYKIVDRRKELIKYKVRDSFSSWSLLLIATRRSKVAKPL